MNGSIHYLEIVFDILKFAKKLLLRVNFHLKINFRKHWYRLSVTTNMTPSNVDVLKLFYGILLSEQMEQLKQIHG